MITIYDADDLEIATAETIDDARAAVDTLEMEGYEGLYIGIGPNLTGHILNRIPWLEDVQ